MVLMLFILAASDAITVAVNAATVTPFMPIGSNVSNAG